MRQPATNNRLPTVKRLLAVFYFYLFVTLKERVYSLQTIAITMRAYIEKSSSDLKCV